MNIYYNPTIIMSFKATCLISFLRIFLGQNLWYCRAPMHIIWTWEAAGNPKPQVHFLSDKSLSAFSKTWGDVSARQFPGTAVGTESSWESAQLTPYPTPPIMTSHQSATFMSHPSNPNNFLVSFTTKSPAQPLFLPHSLLIFHVCGHTACLPPPACLSTDSARSRRSPLSQPMLDTSVGCE